MQAFRFTLDRGPGPRAGAAFRHSPQACWAVATLADIEAWRRVTGIGTVKPSLRVLRKRWNTVKDGCVNAETEAVVARLSSKRSLRRRHWRSCVLEELPIR